MHGSRSKIPSKKYRPYIYDVKFLALLGTPYIYDISRLRVNVRFTSNNYIRILASLQIAVSSSRIESAD
jgi:hypothetical protein